MAQTALSTTGGGPPVVLIHGLGLDGRMWRRQGPALVAAGYTVVTCDLLGHGRSDTPARAGATYTAADLSESLTRALDGVGLDRAAFVGFSLGGAVALWTALSLPDRVAGLVLANTSAWMGPEAPERFMARAAAVEAKGVEVLIQPALERWFTAGFLAARPDIGEHYAALLRQNDAYGYAAACRALATFDVRARLGEIRCPTLVLVGDHDQATPPEMATLMATKIPGASLGILASSGHLSTEECAERFNEHLLGFLRRVTTGAGAPAGDSPRWEQACPGGPDTSSTSPV